MNLGTTWGHPVHDHRKPCAHPVGTETRQKTSPKPLVPLAETGIELRHRRARRRASRRKLRTAGSWETSRPSGPTRSDAHAERDGGPAGGDSGRRGVGRPADRAARRGATRTAEHEGGPPEATPTATTWETRATTGRPEWEAVEEGEAGSGATRRGRRGQPQRQRAGSFTPRQHRARPPGPPEGNLRRRRSGRPRRRRDRAGSSVHADDERRAIGATRRRCSGRPRHRRAWRTRRLPPMRSAGRLGQPGIGAKGGQPPDATRSDGRTAAQTVDLAVGATRPQADRTCNAGPLDLIHRGAPHHVPVCQRLRPTGASDTSGASACRCDADHGRSAAPRRTARLVAPVPLTARVRTPGTPPTVLAWTLLPAPLFRA